MAVAMLATLTVWAPGGWARPKLVTSPLQIRAVEHGSKALSAQLARTDRKLLRLSGGALTPVLVKLDYDAIALYRGGVPGLRPTSPAATGRPLSENRAAVRSYARYIATRERTILDAIRTEIPRTTVRYSYRWVYGGLALSVPAGRIRDLLHVPGVVAVQEDRLEHVQALPRNYRFVGAPSAWSRLGGSRTAGEGVLVGVLDTGIWPEHPMLADEGIEPPGGSFRCEFGDGTDPQLGDPFTCNDKLAGAYAFTDTYMTFIGALDGEFCNNQTGICSARDADGHGTHTATTAAGDLVRNAPIFGIDRGPASGIAPGASVIAYRVCLDQGCFSSDSVAAIQQAVIDGVDVINFSISGGAEPFADPVELAFLDAYAAGVVVAASAGNSGPGPGTAEHGGPWVTTVGASTWDGGWFTTLVLRSGRDELRLPAATITEGMSEPTPVVDAAEIPGYEDGFCSTEPPPGSVAGAVVFCRRGVVGRAEKSFHLAQAGAAGMILANRFVQDLFTDNHWIPTAMTDGRRAFLAIRDFLRSHDHVVASWATSRVGPQRGDAMTTFSSRGPVGAFLKPDVTAPGIQILAGNTPAPVSIFAGPPGELFQAIAGTSMSSPHAAGVAALVRAAHPNWTAGQVRSALMTSSVQDVVDYDGEPATPFEMGAGSIRADRAIRPTLTFDEEAGDFALLGPDPIARLELNIPSIDVPQMPGVVTVHRTVTNVSGRTQTFRALTEVDKGSVVVQPARFSLAPGASREITIIIHGEGIRPGQHFGRITLMPAASATPVTVPVAFVKTQGDVSLSHVCRPERIRVGGASSCTVEITNRATVPAEVHLEVSGPPPSGLKLLNVSAPGSRDGNAATFEGTLDAGVTPQIVSIDPGGSPAGYLPLADLGASPITGIGDEDIVVFDTPPFLYGGETYTAIGFTTDGYAVVGGGDAADIAFIPQAIPDPARPNNVLAPFWTDTNFDFGGSMYAELVSDGTDSWIVLEYADVGMWDVPDTVSFQIWIQVGDAESITDAYGPTTGSGATSVGLVVGAENRDGSSAATLGSIPTTGDDYTVVTTPPVPGGSVSFTYDAVGRRRGTYDVVAALVSDITVGITTEVQTVSVR